MNVLYMLNEKFKLITKTSSMSHVTVSVQTMQIIKFVRHIRTQIQINLNKSSKTKILGP